MKQFLCLALVVVLTGCGSGGSGTTPTTTIPVDPAVAIAANAATITKFSTGATTVGLGFYASQDAAGAKLAAVQIQTVVTSTILPYLNGNAGVSTLAVNAFMKENLLTLPALIQAAISTAATVLDAYVQAPSATTILSPAEYAYIKAFAQGLSDGATAFLNTGAKSIKDAPQNKVGNWLNFSTK